MHKSVDEDPGIESKFVTQKGQQSVCLFFLAFFGVSDQWDTEHEYKYIKGSASAKLVEGTCNDMTNHLVKCAAKAPYSRIGCTLLHHCVHVCF